MMIETVESYLALYFDKHKEKLTGLYPGIQKHHLIDSYCRFKQVKPRSSFVYSYEDTFFQDIAIGRPLEYILQEKYFFQNRFFVNEDVLIPRNETEILVEEALKSILKNKFQKILEIGTGSGCIALSLLTQTKVPLQVTATDISEEALQVAALNHFRLKNLIHPRSQFHLLQKDRLTGIKDSFDLIVTNPPYIDFHRDRDKVHSQTDSYEPHLALYIRDESYAAWFEVLLQQVFGNLAPKGQFMMEGHEDKLQELMGIAKNIFSSCEILKDYTGAERFLICNR